MPAGHPLTAPLETERLVAECDSRLCHDPHTASLTTLCSTQQGCDHKGGEERDTEGEREKERIRECARERERERE